MTNDLCDTRGTEMLYNPIKSIENFAIHSFAIYAFKLFLRV